MPAGFAAGVVADYKTRAFEAAVGETNNDMRLAMNFRREMAELSKGANNLNKALYDANRAAGVGPTPYGLPEK